MSQTLITQSEIHDFGIEAVFGFLKKQKYEIEAVNTDITKNPQIVAKKNGQLHFIIVRTACYPLKGEIESAQVAFHCIEHADKNKAVCNFASVGIANSDGKNDTEMAIPIKGAGYYVAFDGLEILTRSDRARIIK